MKEKRTDKWYYRNPLTRLLSSLSTYLYFSVIVHTYTVIEASRKLPAYPFATSDKSLSLFKRISDRQKIRNSVTGKGIDRLLRTITKRATKRTSSGKVLFDTLCGYSFNTTHKLVPEVGTAINRPGNNLTSRLAISQQIRQF